MSDRKTSVIVGGSSGIGFEVAVALAARGERIVLTSRDAARAEAAARHFGGDAIGLAFDLAEPHAIAGKLAGDRRRLERCGAGVGDDLPTRPGRRSGHLQRRRR